MRPLSIDPPPLLPAHDRRQSPCIRRGQCRAAVLLATHPLLVPARATDDAYRWAQAFPSGDGGHGVAELRPLGHGDQPLQGAPTTEPILHQSIHPWQDDQWTQDFLFVADKVVIVAFTLEASPAPACTAPKAICVVQIVVKCVAVGLFGLPGSFLRDRWNILVCCR